MTFLSKPRTRKCKLCLEHVKSIDYKDTKLLKYYINDRGKILPRKVTGLCAKHQRMVAKAIKAARNIALLPYVNDYIK